MVRGFAASSGCSLATSGGRLVEVSRGRCDVGLDGLWFVVSLGGRSWDEAVTRSTQRAPDRADHLVGGDGGSAPPPPARRRHHGGTLRPGREGAGRSCCRLAAPGEITGRFGRLGRTVPADSQNRAAGRSGNGHQGNPPLSARPRSRYVRRHARDSTCSQRPTAQFSRLSGQRWRAWSAAAKRAARTGW